MDYYDLYGAVGLLDLEEVQGPVFVNLLRCPGIDSMRDNPICRNGRKGRWNRFLSSLHKFLSPTIGFFFFLQGGRHGRGAPCSAAPTETAGAQCGPQQDGSYAESYRY